MAVHENTVNPDDAATRRNVCKTMILLDGLEEICVLDALREAGLVAKAAPPKRDQKQDEALAKENGWKLVREQTGFVAKPHNQRGDWDQSEAIYTAFMSGKIPNILLDPTSMRLEGLGGRRVATNGSQYVGLIDDALSLCLAVVGGKPHRLSADRAAMRTGTEAGGVINPHTGLTEMHEITGVQNATYLRYLRNGEVGTPDAKESLRSTEIVHHYIMGIASGHLDTCNFASAIQRAYQTFPYAVILHLGGDFSARNIGGENNHRSGGTSRDKTRPRWVPEPSASQRPATLCNQYQTGYCSYHDHCIYRHACRECGSTTHGANACRQANTGRRRSRSRSPNTHQDASRRYGPRDDRAGGQRDHPTGGGRRRR